MRKSRDRLHDEIPPRTPDDVTKRRPSRREIDVKYENEMRFQGASAVSFSRRHGEEIYQDIEGGSLVLPDGQERGLLTHVADHKRPDKDRSHQLYEDHLEEDEARVYNSFLLDAAARKDTRTGPGMTPVQRDVMPGSSIDDDHQKDHQTPHHAGMEKGSGSTG